MPEVLQTPLVDQQGNIAIHGRSGASMTLKFQLADGQPRNVSGASIFFEVHNVLRVALGAGQTNDERTLILSRAQVALLSGAPRIFDFVDESGTVPEVFWSGNVRVFGFTEQPA